MNALVPEKALIFRITHTSNVPWILRNGLHCANSEVRDPNFVQIGNPELIAKRTQRNVTLAPKGTLSDYVPFYFTPASPMLYNIKTGCNGVTTRPMREIAIIFSSLRKIQELGTEFVFTDRHAYLQTADIYNQLERLDRIDWPKLQARDFRRDPDDPGRFERYQAEALIYRHVPVTAISGIACYEEERQKNIQGTCDSLGSPVTILCKPSWYF